MSLFGFYFAVILLYITVNASYGIESFASNFVYIVPERAYECGNGKTVIDFDVNLRSKNDDGEKVVDLEFELDVPITEDWLLLITIDQWNNGDWETNFFAIDGAICETMSKYGPKVWDNFKRLIQPAISGRCTIEPGRYKLTDFTVKQTDMIFPIAAVGKFRITVELFDEQETEIVCYVVEAEIKK